ncbi:unnamed protein product [Peniophora sp. CBMAI 1063]|nr:unnamed protein product [Peniophora sp. CBMAI 1063]
MARQWSSDDYARLRDVINDSPLPELVSAISNHSNRRILARSLNAELQRREKHLQLIREYCNLLSAPIHTLPPELLSHILFLSADGEGPDSLYTLGWTRYLLVCRRWRDVAYSTPALWSFVSLEPPELFTFPPPTKHNDLILRRFSAQCRRNGFKPTHMRIFLYAPQYDKEFFGSYQPFPWVPSSLSSLRAHGSTSGLTSILARMETHHHPLLSHLEVRLIVAERQKPRPFIADSFFSRHTTLRELVVVGIIINFGLLHNLRVLEVLHPYNDDLTIEVDHILDALSRCPTLRLVHLNLPHNATALHGPRRQGVHMPNVESIQFGGSRATITPLLLSLHLPAGCGITMTSWDEAQPQDFVPLISYLKAHYCRSYTSITDIRLGQTDTSRLFEIIWFPPATWSDPSRSEVRKQSETTSMIRLSNVVSQLGVCAEFAAVALSHLPVSDTKTLDMGLTTNCHPAVLRSIFEHLPSLRAVVVSCGQQHLSQFLELLKARLAVRLPAPVQQITIDAANAIEESGPKSRPIAARAQSTAFRKAKKDFEDILSYASSAKAAHMPLDIIDVINDGDLTNDPAIVNMTPGASKKRLWRALSTGFRHNGVMRNKAVVEAELERAHRGNERESLLEELNA